MQIGGLSEGILSLGEQDNNRLRPVKAKGETHEKICKLTLLIVVLLMFVSVFTIEASARTKMGNPYVGKYSAFGGSEIPTTTKRRGVIDVKYVLPDVYPTEFRCWQGRGHL